ncbi:thiamine diphosphate-binding protein [Agrocybe pediades]|nr:thiamine diphosphate-binding protein [Agrocybe pediades]
MSSESTPVFTASTLLLKALSSAGITHAFVNWGSDHPALLEDLERQRTEARDRENSEGDDTTRPSIVTCPNEMVALSAAQGFAQATGKPAAVIIHVDVGTQALAGAVHNVDRSRTPVLIYAGASAISSDGQAKGSRNEWIMWLQDIPDQSAIVRQYMRHTSQIGSAKTVESSVKRALQIATSSPKGPVYLWARREVMEEEVQREDVDAISGMTGWPSVEPSALTISASTKIAQALLTASSPLIITSHIGRTPAAAASLLSLANLLAIPVISSCPSAVNIPASHPSYIGVTFLAKDTHWEKLDGADLILVIECDLPWIPANEKPAEGTRVFIIDGGDPLHLNVGSWAFEAEMVCRADGGVACHQIEEALIKLGVRSPGEPWSLDSSFDDARMESMVQFRREVLVRNHARVSSDLDKYEKLNLSLRAIRPGERDERRLSYPIRYVVGILRRAVDQLVVSQGGSVLFLNESISNFPAVWTHLRPEVTGSVISSGGSSLGWALGAAVGASLGAKTLGVNGDSDKKGYNLVVAIVGDGSYMFGVPSSAYWMARRYNTPFLTIVLNNGGWNSPRLSMIGVTPAGYGRSTRGDQLTVGFGPDAPDYSQIAVAASSGWAWGARAGGPGGLPQTGQFSKAVRVVVEEKRCAVVDCALELI